MYESSFLPLFFFKSLTTIFFILILTPVFSSLYSFSKYSNKALPTVPKPNNPTFISIFLVIDSSLFYQFISYL